MLHEFLTENRDELIARCVAKVAKRPVPPPTDAEMMHGIPLRSEAASDEPASRRISGVGGPGTSPTASEIGESAVAHGDELQKKGFTVDQVVHDYGDLCQAITELAVEQAAPPYDCVRGVQPRPECRRRPPRRRASARSCARDGISWS